MIELAATVFDMYSNRRQLAGVIVRDEIARRGLSVKEASALTRVAPATINRVLVGTDTITTPTLLAIEGGFGWPLRLLTYVIDGDAVKIERLPGLREDLRQFILDSLSEFGQSAEEQTQ